MSLSDFITKYNNKYVEVVDPTNYAQCFDLVLQWCVDNGIPKNIFPFMYAYQIYTNFGPTQAKYFDRIYNSPDAIAKEGDILVWSNNFNYAGGHTAICKTADLYTITAFSQNDPNKTASQIRTYNYYYILGWLRMKNYNQPLTPEQKIAKVITILNTSGITDTQRVQKIRTVLGV